MTKRGYKINPIEKTITLSRKFLEGASVMDSPEYKELKRIQKENPDYTLVEREKIKQKEDKVTYSELTYAVMESIIRDSATDDADEAQKIAAFNGIKDFYKDNKATMYGHVKSWFVNNYKKEYIDKYGNQAQKKAA